MKTPVALIIYHRSQTTRKIIKSLREVKASEIFVIADGPKNVKDAERCAETRALIKLIDWKCNVHKLYSSTNMGLRKRIVTGLNWVFSKVDRAIILEDDLVIDKSFYRFCEEMLEKYKNNMKIISIAGNNFLDDTRGIQESYYFSRHVYSWGWATWRRAWHLYDDKMSNWPSIKKSGLLKETLKGNSIYLYWKGIFDLTKRHAINSWAYAWMYTAYVNHMLTIIPVCNLVSNVGVGKDATNTLLKARTLALTTKSMKFPLKHPEAVKRNDILDAKAERILYVTPRNAVGLIIRLLLSHIKPL